MQWVKKVINWLWSQPIVYMYKTGGGGMLSELWDIQNIYEIQMTSFVN